MKMPFPSVQNSAKPSAESIRSTASRRTGESQEDFPRQLDQARTSDRSETRPDGSVAKQQSSESAQPSRSPSPDRDRKIQAESNGKQVSEPGVDAQIKPTEPTAEKQEPQANEPVNDGAEQVNQPDVPSDSHLPEAVPAAVDDLALLMSAQSMSTNQSTAGFAQASRQNDEIWASEWSSVSPASLKELSSPANKEAQAADNLENSSNTQVSEVGKNRAAGPAGGFGIRLASLEQSGLAKPAGEELGANLAMTAVMARTAEGTNSTVTTNHSSQPAALPDLPPDDPQAQANVARVARGLQTAMQQRGGAVTLRLDPPELGSVKIQMQVHHDGQVSARFMVQNESVNDLLTHRMSQLKQALEGQGLSVDRLEVTTQSSPSNGASSQGNQAGQSPGTDDGRSRGQFARQDSGRHLGGDNPDAYDSRQEMPESFQERLHNLVA